MGLKVIEERSQPVTETGCWLWEQCAHRKGYGLIYYKGKTQRAHRLAFLLANGNMPEGSHVLHKCDTPLCVNPEHLFLGNNYDNVQDKVRKGRQPRGEQMWASKLTEEQVEFIRNDPRTGKELGEIFGINRNTINKIKAGTAWKHR